MCQYHFFISTLSFLYAHRAFCSFEVLVYELIMDIAASVLNFSAFRDIDITAVLLLVSVDSGP